MKRVLLIILVQIFFSVGLDAKRSGGVFVTPEDFGCVSGDIRKADHNAQRLQRMVDYASERGLKIVAKANKEYFISRSIIISSPVSIDFNRATLIATDTFSIIKVKSGKGRQFSGSISGISFNLNNKAKSGLTLDNAIKLHVSDCWFYKIPSLGTGLLVEKGYEVFCNNLHLEGGEKGAIGIVVKTHDCHFSDCAIIDCSTAVENCGCNFFDRIHAWMGYGGRWLKGSTFFKIKTKGPVFLNQCFSDTFDKVFDICCTTNLVVSQHRNFHNKGMWNKKKIEIINPVIFYFEDDSICVSSNVYITDSYIDGLYFQGNERQSFSNKVHHKININNSYIVKKD